MSRRVSLALIAAFVLGALALAVVGLLGPRSGLDVAPAPEQEAMVPPESGSAPEPQAPAVMPPTVGIDPELDVPQFPWPPPRASASVVMPPGFLRLRELTLGDAAKLINAALDGGGYVDRSYFAAPGGFAMVTRLERIDADGTPKQEERWSVESPPLQSFSLGAYLRALFTAPAGYYRIIVFVVSSQPFAQAAEGVSRDDALAWLHEGLNRLPDSIASALYTERHDVTALIYQFEQPGRQDALLVLQGGPTGREHLERAQLWGAFSP